MLDADAPRPGEVPAPDDPEAALKKTPPRPTQASTTAAKTGKEARDARLGAALRENLRRRKAAQKKDKD